MTSTWRRLPLRGCVVGMTAAVLVIAVGFANGGWAPGTWRLCALGLFSLTAAGVLTKEQLTLSRNGVIAVASLAGLAGWMLLSMAWSGRPELAAEEAERCLVYVGGLLAVIVLVEAREVRFLLWGLLAGSAFLSAWATAGFFLDPAGERDQGLLAGPLKYPNGAGILACLGIVLAIGLALTVRQGTAIVAIVSLGATVPALVLSKSWGAWGALALGTAAVVGFYRPSGWRLILAGTSVVALTLGVVGAASPHLVNSLTENPRGAYWHAALNDYAAHPLLGSGAGTYGSYWLAHPRLQTGVLDAHSLYVETLAELGIVGLALIVVFIGSVLSVARRPPVGPAPIAVWVLAVYLVHAAVDWDWELPAVTLTAVLAAGGLLVAARADAPAVPLTYRQRLLLLGGSLAIAAIAAVRCA